LFLNSLLRLISFLWEHLSGEVNITRFVTRTDGFVPVKDVLDCRQLHNMRVTFKELVNIVRSNDKQRFELKEEESAPLMELLSIDSRNGNSHSLGQL
jgi:RNA:NAD 2'-phosphotransferase (TPT1/KptA family)